MILTFCELNVSVETQELSLQTAEEKDEEHEETEKSGGYDVTERDAMLREYANPFHLLLFSNCYLIINACSDNELRQLNIKLVSLSAHSFTPTA